ncbi:hypothetical protein KFK09_006129 [Dendrobium nobile]|uniref:Uncharacterized protein n=1 Tax=Dendrobium nobile TaxID=94219 RepID=A0A8T3BSQ5_DENNO|nr:hypothetical protein KFK09_006129 [Dendrobium nobile]
MHRPGRLETSARPIGTVENIVPAIALKGDQADPFGQIVPGRCCDRPGRSVYIKADFSRFEEREKSEIKNKYLRREKVVGFWRKVDFRTTRSRFRPKWLLRNLLCSR